MRWYLVNCLSPPPSPPNILVNASLLSCLDASVWWIFIAVCTSCLLFLTPFLCFAKLPSRNSVPVFSLPSNRVPVPVALPTAVHQPGYCRSLLLFVNLLGRRPILLFFTDNPWILVLLKAVFIDSGGSSCALCPSSWDLEASPAQ